MNNIVFISTSRNGILSNILNLNDFCVSLGMKNHTSKSKSMVIHGNIDVKQDLIVQ